MNLIPKNKNLLRSSIFLRNKGKLAIVALAIMMVVFVGTIHNGLMSFLSSLVGESVSAQETSTAGISYNSSTNPFILQAANNFNPISTSSSELAVADDTLIPFVRPSGSIADIDDQPSSTAISIYVVQPGDTLSQIALMFDVSVNTIVWANDLGTKPVIQPGETLVILPVSGINYTVKKGDTLASIVKKYGGDITEVMEYNGLSTDSSIAIGDTIMIPDGELGGSSVSSGETAHSSSGASSSYEPLIPGDGGPAIPGYYACPVHGSWLSQGLHGHNAVDLALGIGNPIYAAADGTVIIARTGGWNGGYGNYVVISHPNDTETLYAHAEKLLVKAGEQVTQGEEIAKIGVTGETTGPHLHFEVRGAANPFLTVKC